MSQDIYIIPKFPKKVSINDVVADCHTALCVPVSSCDTLATILNKLCAKIVALETIIENGGGGGGNTAVYSLVNGENTLVTGTGSPDNPWQVNVDLSQLPPPPPPDFDTVPNLYIPSGTGYIVLSVNGNFADSTGNITLDTTVPSDGTYVLSGGVVTWLHDLVFYVTPAVYYINGVRYTFPGGEVSLEPADPDYPSVDRFTLNDQGVVEVLYGTPDPNPVAPQVNPLTQIYLTDIFLNPGATQPGVTSTIIWDEGVEWDAVAEGTIAETFGDSTEFVQGSLSIDVEGWDTDGALVFSTDTLQSRFVVNNLSLWLKLTAPLAADKKISVQFFNDFDAVSSAVDLSFNRELIDSWQLVALSLAQPIWAQANFNTVKFGFGGASTDALHLDVIQLQGGMGFPQVDTPVDTNFANTDLTIIEDRNHYVNFGKYLSIGEDTEGYGSGFLYTPGEFNIWTGDESSGEYSRYEHLAPYHSSYFTSDETDFVTEGGFSAASGTVAYSSSRYPKTDGVPEVFPDKTYTAGFSSSSVRFDVKEVADYASFDLRPTLQQTQLNYVPGFATEGFVFSRLVQGLGEHKAGYADSVRGNVYASSQVQADEDNTQVYSAVVGEGLMESDYTEMSSLLRGDWFRLRAVSKPDHYDISHTWDKNSWTYQYSDLENLSTLATTIRFQKPDANYEITVPAGNGTLALSVNDIFADEAGNIVLDLPATTGSFILSGGVVTWQHDLVFNVSPCIYYINGVRYTSPSTDIDLAPSDPTDPRIDTFAVTSSGTAVAVKGTAAPSPSIPQVDQFTQLYLTSVLIPAAATTPGGITKDMVYNENIEWTTSTQGIIAANANSTLRAKLGTKSFLVSSSSGGLLLFTNSGPLAPGDFSSIEFQLYLTGKLRKQDDLTLQFYNGTTAVSSKLTVSLDKSLLNSWQLIALSFSQFTFTPSATFNQIRLGVSGTPAPLSIDVVQLQSGVTQPPVGGGVTSVNATATGALNFTGGPVTTAGTLALGWTGTNSQLVQGDGTLVNKSTFALSSRAVNTRYSLTGGGDLSADRTLNLVGDVSAPGNNKLYGTDAAGVRGWYDQPTGGGGGGTPVTADNGLTVNVGSNVQLGGTLLAETTVNTDSYKLVVSGTSVSNNAVLQVATSGTTGKAIVATSVSNTAIQGTGIAGEGVKGVSSSSYGVTGVSDTGPGGYFESFDGTGLAVYTANGLGATIGIAPVSQNTVERILRLNRYTSGSPIATGMGGSIDFEITSFGGGDKVSNRLVSKWSNAVAANVTANFEIWGSNNGTVDRQLLLQGDGTLTLDRYTSVVAGTAAYILGVDSTGKVITTAPGGGGGASLTADNGLTVNVDSNVQLGGTLSKDTLIDTGDFTLTLAGAATGFDEALRVTNLLSGGGIYALTQGGTAILGESVNSSGVKGVSDSYYGIFGVSNSGVGGNFTSVDSAGVYTYSINSVALWAVAAPESTNDVGTIATFARVSQNYPPAAGLGGSLDFQLATTVADTVSTQLVSKWTNATEASSTADFEILVRDNNVMGRKLALTGEGILTLDRYAASVSGTAAFNLAVDNTGKVITVATGGGGSSLSGITLNTPNLLFSNPVTFSETTGAWSGTLALNTQAANKVLAGPASGAAATPTFRSLVAADLPDLSASYVPVSSLVVYTSGTTYTVANGNNVVYIDPASTAATLTLTLPATPHASNTLYLHFGGTLSSGTVVTSFTVAPNSGQAVLDANGTSYGPVQAGESIAFRYRSSTQKWYRL